MTVTDLPAARTTRGDGGRRGLQIVLGALSAIPFASGLAGVLVGPMAVPGEKGSVPASVDNEYRYAHAIWFAAAPVIWKALPRIEHETTTLRAISGAVVLGGVGRLLSWRATGRPHPVFVAGIALELLAIPAVVAWHSRVARLARG
jgi:hypothetical protein